jgi:hypothetical protein
MAFLTGKAINDRPQSMTPEDMCLQIPRPASSICWANHSSMRRVYR